MSKTWKALLAVALLSPVMATAYTLGDVKSPPGPLWRVTSPALASRSW